ncbi:MAG: M23 family metallopeptidase [Chloroflexota bacterium]
MSVRSLCVLFAFALLLSVLPACASPGGASVAGGQTAVWTPLAQESFTPTAPPLLMLPHSSPSLTPPPPTPRRVRSATPQAPTLTPTPTLSPTPSPSPTSTPAFMLCSPLQGYPLARLSKIVSDPYRPPPPGSDARHQGVDFTYHRLAGEAASIEGVVVLSVLRGRVAASVSDSFPFGNLVIIETAYDILPSLIVTRLGIPPGDSLYLLYAHMREAPLVSLNQEVTACHLIGHVGKSGNTEAAHLHLEARTGPPGAVFDGMSAFVGTVTPQERKNYDLWRTSGAFQHFDPMRLLIPWPWE